jgi:hypothetical protein
MRITRKFLRKHNAFYTDAEIVALVPARGVTALQVARGDIPPEDRIWVLTRPGALPDSVLWEWTARTVGRALTRVAKPDPRSLAVVPLLRRLAKGEAISQAELDEARAAAWAAARAADSAAASAADRAAARAEAWAAASAADRAAERQAQISDIIQILDGTP